MRGGGCRGGSYVDEDLGILGIKSSAQALTAEHARILGFETPAADWSTSNGGAVLGTSGISSQGATALSVLPNGWTEIDSVALSSLGTSKNTATIDIRLPETVYWGEVRIILVCPSKSVWWLEAGSASISGLSPNSYHALSFSLSTDAKNLISSSYSDLKIKAVVNAPRLSSPYLLDNLVIVEDVSPDTDSEADTELPDTDNPFYVLPDNAVQNNDPAPSQYSSTVRLKMGMNRPNGVSDNETYGEWSCESSSIVDAQDSHGAGLKNGEFSLSFRALSLLDKGDGCNSGCCGSDDAVPSALFNNDFNFSYRSDLRYNGPWGKGWDFNYGSFVFSNESSIMIMDGAGSVRRYIPGGGDGVYIPEKGVFRELRVEPSGKYSLRYPNGTVIVYYALEGVLSGKLESIKDRDGNMRTFTYDEAGILTAVRDSRERSVALSYNPQGKLSSLVDYTGRTVSFVYDELLRLVEIRLPAVTDTSDGNDFPEGIAYRFGYDEHDRIVAVTYPNESATDGSPRVQITYDNSGRVVSELVGGTNASEIEAGGVIQYSYHEAVNEQPAYTEVIDRNENITHYIFNSDNLIISRKDYTNRNIRPDDPDYFETQYAYDNEFNLISEIRPLGNIDLAVFDNESSDILARGNKLKEIQIPDVARGGDQAEIKTEYDYEPVYQQIARVRKPRSFDLSTPQTGCFSNPDSEFVETYVFDYQEGSSLAALSALRGVSIEVLESRLSGAEIELGLGDINFDGITTQNSGHVIKAVHPKVHLFDFSMQALKEGRQIQVIEDIHRFSNDGLLSEYEDPEGSITSYEYNENGLLTKTTVDARMTERRRYSTVLENITKQTIYNEHGNIISIIDERGVENEYEVTALNQTIRETKAVRLHPNERAGYGADKPLSYNTYQVVDANGNVTETWEENKDSTQSAEVPLGEYIKTYFVYDILDRLIAEQKSVSLLGPVIEVSSFYDANGNLVERRNPDYAENTCYADIYEYDERDLQILQILAPGSDEEGMKRSFYDANGNLVAVETSVDSTAGGKRTVETGYDGFDRAVYSKDSKADGTERFVSYNAASNLIVETIVGNIGDEAGTIGELSKRGMCYDEMDREVSELTYLFKIGSTVRNTILVDGALNPGDGIISNYREYDRKGSVTYEWDDRNKLTVYENNATGDFSTAIDSEGNEIHQEYDGAGNIVERQVTDNSQVGVQGVNSEYTAYTATGRVARSTNNAGETTYYDYDSRGQVVRESKRDGDLIADPLGQYAGQINSKGSTKTIYYDGLGRIVKTETEVGKTEEFEPKLCGFAVYSKEKTDVRNSAAISGANAGSQGRVDVGVEAEVTGDVKAGSFIVLNDRSYVDGNVISGGEIEVRNQVEVTGDVAEFQTVEPIEIETRTVVYGTESISVQSGQNVSISPGAYDEIHIYSGATAMFSAGTYTARRFIVEASSATLKMDAQNGVVDIATEEQLSFADFMTVELVGISKESDVRFYTNGTGQVKIGTDSIFKGVVTAPEAEVYVFSRSEVKGALFAKRVIVDVDSSVEGIGCQNPPDEDGIITIEYEHDNSGQTTAVKDDRGNTTIMTYNCRGLLASRINADGTAVTHEYNLDGEKTKTTDERGNVFSFTRNDKGNVVRTDITRASGTEGTTLQLFRYDGLGRKTMMFDNNDPSVTWDDSTVTRVYDSLSRIVEEDQDGELVSYGYESFVDGAVQLIYPNGDTMTPEYDSMERETAISYNEQEVVNKVYFGQGDKLLNVVLGGRILGDRTENGTPGYDDAERPVYLSYRDIQNPATIWLTYRNSYDRNGNLVGENMDSKVLSNFSKTYRYDKNNRMVSFQSGRVDPVEGPQNVHDEKWILDGTGNRVLSKLNNTLSVYSANEMNQYESVNSNTYTYDNSGNMQREETIENSQSVVKDFKWDAFNRLVEYKKTVGTSILNNALYNYDAENRRTYKQVDEEVKQAKYVYRDKDVINETARVDGFVNRNVNYIIGENIDKTYGFVDNLTGTKYYYLKDQFDNVGGIVDENGNDIEYYKYLPYGQVQITDAAGIYRQESQAGNNIFFQSRELDKESGMYYYRARYYAPNLGRFISIDPILFDQSLNQYTFVENNPGTYNDPTGHMAHAPKIKNCSTARTGLLQIIDSIAEKVMKPARKYTDQKNKVYRQCGKKEFRKWFGCPIKNGRSKPFSNRRHWAHVESNIRQMNNEFAKGKRYYECVDEDGKRATASVGWRYIKIKNDFWKQWVGVPYIETGAHTLIHETAHKKGATFRGEEHRGDRACLKLAVDNHKIAKENADSYASFIDERYYGITHNVNDDRYKEIRKDPDVTWGILR